jgi:hypothetical protein
MKKFILSMLSEADGTVSSARCLSCLFAVLAIGVIIAVFRHLMSVKDPAILALWLSALPSVGGILVALMSSGYAVNKIPGSFSELLSGLSGFKKDR